MYRVYFAASRQRVGSTTDAHRVFCRIAATGCLCRRIQLDKYTQAPCCNTSPRCGETRGGGDWLPTRRRAAAKRRCEIDRRTNVAAKRRCEVNTRRNDVQYKDKIIVTKGVGKLR